MKLEFPRICDVEPKSLRLPPQLLMVKMGSVHADDLGRQVEDEEDGELAKRMG